MYLKFDKQFSLCFSNILGINQGRSVGRDTEARVPPYIKNVNKKNVMSFSFIVYILCLICFLIYVYNIFKTFKEFWNTKLTKYTDSVRKHHCEANVIKKISYKKFIFFQVFNFHKNLDSKRPQLLLYTEIV